MAFIDTVLWPIEVVVAWIMVQFHSFFTWLGLASDSGNAWVLSIVGLVIVMRIVLIPLFVKQIKASRGLQLIQPQMQKLQAKYKGKTDPASRQAMQQEMMALYREAGTNPFASCLPILAQSPIFFALFRVLNSLPAVAEGTLPSGRESIGPLTAELAAEAESSTLFGAPLSSAFVRAAEYGDAAMNVRIVTVILIILMSVTTFTTQRQLTMKNMPAAALDNPMARQQRMLMYILPVIFAVSGINFPIGVLIYWFTTNLWSMGQQFYVIRRMPAPGSEAEAALKARRAKRAKKHGKELVEDETPQDTKPGGQRVQPVRKDRQRPPRPATEGTGPAAQQAAGGKAPAGGKTGGKPGQGGGGSAKSGGSAQQGRAADTGQGQRAQGQPTQGQRKQQPGGQRSGQQRPPRQTASGERPAPNRQAGSGGGSGTAPKKRPPGGGQSSPRPPKAAGTGSGAPEGDSAGA